MHAELPIPPLLISEREAARLLGVSPRTIFTLSAQGKLPHLKIGRLKKFDLADIHLFIEREKVSNERN